MKARPEQTSRFRPSENYIPEEKCARSRADRVDNIRDLVDSGDYEVPAMAVAERMLHLITLPRRAAEN